jgi:hypothetical protein
VLTPGTAGEVLKTNSIVVLAFTKANESAGIPLHIKSVGCTVAGSTGSLTLTSKTVGGVVTMLPQPALTEQDVGSPNANGIAQSAESTEIAPRRRRVLSEGLSCFFIVGFR